MGKENLYIAGCYILHKELKNYNRFGLDGDEPFIDLHKNIPISKKLDKVLIMGNFNARVGKYQHMEIPEESIVDPCVLRDSKDCIVMNYGRLLIHML